MDCWIIFLVAFTSAVGVAFGTEYGSTGSTGVIGPAGYAGKTGATGQRGYPGEKGPRGPSGPVGEVGIGGGRQGATGFTGSSGRGGSTGATGRRGNQGEPGVQGRAASTGGATGGTGSTGRHGPSGPSGPVGERGSAGPSGPRGVPGMIGTPGGVGIRGMPGFRGQAGSKGPKGPDGDVGPPGPPGPICEADDKDCMNSSPLTDKNPVMSKWGGWASHLLNPYLVGVMLLWLVLLSIGILATVVRGMNRRRSNDKEKHAEPSYPMGATSYPGTATYPGNDKRSSNYSDPEFVKTKLEEGNTMPNGQTNGQAYGAYEEIQNQQNGKI